MHLPVAHRTREREALKYRKLHEQILRQKGENESFSGSRRSKDLKISSDSSCDNGVGKLSSQSTKSFSGSKKIEGKRKVKVKAKRSSGSTGIDNVSRDFGFHDHNAKDSNLGVAADHANVFDLGSSNLESDSFGANQIQKTGTASEKISVKLEVEESCSGTKCGNSGTSSGTKFIDDDEVIVISDGSVEFSSDGESENEDEVVEISGDGFQVSSSGESDDDDDDDDGGGDDDEDYKEENFDSEEHMEASVSSEEASIVEELSSGDEAEKSKVPSKRIGESGKRENIEPPLRVRSRFEAAFDSNEKGKREQTEPPLRVRNGFEAAFDSNEKGIKEQTEPQLKTRKRFEASFDSDGSECDVLEVGFMSKRKRAMYESRIRNHKVDIVEILGNSLFNDEVEEEEEEEVVIPEPELPKLPLKFTFGVEEPPPVEKTAEEKELDALWTEMDLALCGQDTYNAPVGNEAEPSAEIADDCSQGKHVLFLDEEIGLKCKFCGFVEQEIRYHTAPFSKNPFGRSERRGLNHEQIDVSGKLHLHDLGDDALYGDDFNYDIRGTVWDIIRGIGKDLHPHQRDGFAFLWKNIGGGIELDKLDSDKGSGCIISHAPGTGKTRLAIVFLQTYMKMFPSCKPVIIAPCGMLLYWESEFKKWNVNIPFHNLNNPKLSGKENASALRIARSRSLNVKSTRMIKLYSWKRDRSVLALSYQLFKELVGEDDPKRRKKMRLRTREEANVQKVLLEVPNLLFLDEGHTPRNEHSQIWKAFLRVQTKKRIILSGTPFQNNLDELFNTIYLVRPQISDLFSSELNECFVDRRLKNIEKKLWNSLVGPIGKEDTNAGLEAKRLKALRDMIRPFVHVHEGNILQQKLPGLRDAVIVLQPDQFQKVLLDRVEENKSFLEMEYFISLISLHPSLCPEKLVDKENCSEVRKLESLRLNADAGVKTKFLMELIRISDYLNEKVLVFSQYHGPLELIRDQLVQRFKWSEDREILHMDGKTTAADRQSKIKVFNDMKSEAKVMLASTRAFSEGINLVGASRVVLVDVVWNPQVERQAISRAYRLGQTKVVYIYHLITCGTREEEKYRTQARKERLSDLVFYSPERTRNHKELSDDKKDRILESIVEGNKLTDVLKKIIYESKVNWNDEMLHL